MLLILAGYLIHTPYLPHLNGFRIAASACSNSMLGLQYQYSFQIIVSNLLSCEGSFEPIATFEIYGSHNIS